MTDLTHDAPDDGFHEIQLSGKQLVFLFMATTVVSVVIFLCGVLVGRGVRGEPLNAADSTSAALSTAGPGATASPSTPPPAITDGTAGDKKLTYTERLQADSPVSEAVKTPAPATVPPPVPQQAAVEPVTKPETAPAADKPLQRVEQPAAVASPAAGTPKAQPGVWAVQVVALTDHAAATAVMQRLSSKGYPAFLVQPTSGAAVKNYKVQVGRFEDRSKAEETASRLKKEEQFQPWILR